MTLGLALQGIGGRNTFNQGVLYALRQANIKPTMISATSGAIISLYYYLDPNPDALLDLNKPEENGEKCFDSFIYDSEVKKIINFLLHIFQGKPGVFKPYIKSDSLYNFIPNPFIFSNWLNLFFPAKIYEPERPDSFFVELSKRVNHAAISIVTNAYNYKTGKTVVYLNKLAKKLLKNSRFNFKNTEFEVCPLNAKGLKACVHLLQYGDPYDGKYDGAYQYNPFIPPLKICDNIIVISAASLLSQKKPIMSFFDVESFKIKMWLNNGLYSEISTINLINNLINTKIINHPNIHPINLTVIEPSIDVEFFDFFVDNPTLFFDGMEQAKIITQKR